MACRTGSRSTRDFAPDGKRIATFGNEAAPRFWDAATLKEIVPYEGHQNAVLGAAFTADGKELATASNESFVHVWDVATGRVRRVGQGTHAIESIALSRTGGVLAISRSQEWPALWDLRRGKLLRQLRLQALDAGGGGVQLSADGKTLAAGTGWGAVRFWDVASARELPVVCKGDIAPTGNFYQKLRFVLAPDGKTLAAMRTQRPDSGVVVWDAVKGTPRRTLAGQGEPGAFAPDSRLVAILDGKEVRVVDVVTAAVVCGMHGDGVRVLCAAFSPDGGTLAVAGVGGTVSLWEVATGQRRGRRSGHAGAVNCLAFAPDGRRLASGGDDHTVLIWDLTDGIRPGPLTGAARNALWTSLAGADAAMAYHAIWRLAGDPERVVPLLKARLRPVAPADAKQIARCIDLLDSEDFTERDRATRQLADLAELAEAALRRAQKQSRTLEQRRRIENLLQRLPTRALAPDELRHLRAIEILEHAGTDDAKQLLETLAAGASDARLTRAARAAVNRLRRVS